MKKRVFKTRLSQPLQRLLIQISVRALGCSYKILPNDPTLRGNIFACHIFAYKTLLKNILSLPVTQVIVEREVILNKYGTNLKDDFVRQIK